MQDRDSRVAAEGAEQNGSASARRCDGASGRDGGQVSSISELEANAEQAVVRIITFNL